jgi:type III pantothenate kinase
MKLLIDAGNTRIKWALVRGADWLRTGVLETAAVQGLSGDLAGVSEVREIWVSNVAGEAVVREIRALKLGPHGAPVFLRASEACAGVHNGYAHPAQLGSDRWAALIAARRMTMRTCLVVNAGTATTIDTLRADGTFTGGLILPGIELMQRSLTERTQLPVASGRYANFPDNTGDALFSGAIQATCGAIVRQHALLTEANAPVLLAGGAAALLQAHLQLPCQLVDNLVLRGLEIVAMETTRQ